VALLPTLNFTCWELKSRNVRLSLLTCHNNLYNNEVKAFENIYIFFLKDFLYMLIIINIIRFLFSA